MKRLFSFVAAAFVIAAAPINAEPTPKLKALIIDGQNNHAVWPKSTIMMREYLKDTGLFEVDIARSQYTWRAKNHEKWLPLAGVGETQDLEESKADPDFKPEFSKYDVVISNFGWKAADWPKSTQRALEDYMENGGGFVVVHAASNSFGQWDEYNRMIGLGGWGGRNEKSGPYVYYNMEGELVRDTSPGRGGAHGGKEEFPITVRVPDHPITKGMPAVWMTTKDECYAKLRGPAENMTILATGYDLTVPNLKRHEPALMTIEYGEGRTFHTILGDNVPGFESVGFIVSFTRGAEWAATGDVTQPIPDDFPTADQSSRRPFPALGTFK
ncbi:MAG: ThuA domain-containing protein [Planctomycetota bacterium]